MDSSDPEISGGLVLHVVGNHTSVLNLGFHGWEWAVSFAISERQLFDPAVRKRGADLAGEGAVRIQKSKTTEVHAEVLSSSGYGSYLTLLLS